MGRKSTVDLLPEEFKEALNALLRDPAVTQLEAAEKVNQLLQQAGEDERVSKSAINRYSMRMDKIGAKLKQSREISNMWIAKLGSQPQGQVGHLLNEVVRNLAFDTAIALSEEEDPVPPKLIKELSIAIEKLEKAASENEKRTAQIRQQAREEAAEELTQELKNDGISQELEDSIKRILLGK
jgi:DNA-binding transcriptional regulator WhiA